VRAAEGNCRDFLSIFCEAVFAFRKDSTKNRIGIPHVRDAAARYYQTEKEANVKADAYAFAGLEHLLQDVLRDYKSRIFMVETSKENHARIVAPLNARVIHKLNKYYTHPDRKAVRYSLFSLDYGAYAQFMRTRAQPSLELPRTEGFETEEVTDEGQYALPKDDSRSYRRIVFDPDALRTFEEP
jgi:hypothetical protein